MNNLFWKLFGPKCEICKTPLQWRYAKYCKEHGLKIEPYGETLKEMNALKERNKQLEIDNIYYANLAMMPWCEDMQHVMKVVHVAEDYTFAKDVERSKECKLKLFEVVANRKKYIESL